MLAMGLKRGMSNVGVVELTLDILLGCLFRYWCGSLRFCWDFIPPGSKELISDMSNYFINESEGPSDGCGGYGMVLCSRALRDVSLGFYCALVFCWDHYLGYRNFGLVSIIKDQSTFEYNGVQPCLTSYESEEYPAYQKMPSDDLSLTLNDSSEIATKFGLPSSLSAIILLLVLDQLDDRFLLGEIVGRS
ncbi:hypothetical protein DAPPUDRAFT_246502 [Daphnia pulex]|uniref:Uncharacterized protein n=1 Tax=Daphnia pulex TaxID=6669 RepID=E9GQP1_DAPPU|nr:hypothetical protein DAPPUDRAFT_246502 [Daphnia pulex]|eukprot:EFX78147.1 hypothetical protein DAPPUDRAFT_246502 [Daphnia pulex]